MVTSEKGIEFIKSWERLFLHAYDDWNDEVPHAWDKIRGTLTIGWGHTTAAGPPHVWVGMEITESQAEAILKADLTPVEIEVGQLVKVAINQAQFDALVSFQYNTGWLEHPHCSLLTALNAGNFSLADKDFMLYNRGNGRVLKGLTRRRKAEMEMFDKGVYHNNE